MFARPVRETALPSDRAVGLMVRSPRCRGGEPDLRQDRRFESHAARRMRTGTDL